MKQWKLLTAAVLIMLLLLSACAGDPDTSSVSPAPSESESSSTVTDAGDTSAQPDESQPAGDEGAASTPDVEGEPEKEPEPTPEQTPDAQPEKEPEAEPAPEVTPTPEVTPDPSVKPSPEATPAPEASETVEPTPVHTHKYTDKVVAPTCEKGGYTVHTCDCGHSYSDTETKAAGHKYSDKVVAPTTSAQGYTLHTCSVCGNSYKDSYVDKLPEEKPADPKPTEPSNPGNTDFEEGGWKGDDYGSNEDVIGDATVAGEFVDNKDFTREFYKSGMSAEDARQALNRYIYNVYSRKFFADGIKKNQTDEGKFARFVTHSDGRLGINVFQWRKSYDSSTSTNTSLNAVMEAFYFFTKDKDVAHALFSWTDAAAINNGDADSNNFGFTDVRATANGGVIKMNGIQIEADFSDNSYTYYFN